MSQQQFPEWLKSLGSIRADLWPADRQLPYSFAYKYEGNVTSAAIDGSIKIGPNSDDELAEFTFGTPVYDSGTNLTSWSVSLAKNDVDGLPAGDSGVDHFYYDILVGDVRAAAGLFTVRGYISETE